MYCSIVLNCPAQSKYTVYLSEMMTNTTMSRIYNEINKYDDELNIRYDETDYIRKIEVSNVRVDSVRKSMETDGLESVIVIFVNETESTRSSRQHTMEAKCG